MLCSAPRRPPLHAPEAPVVKAQTESSVTLGWSPPPAGDRPAAIEGYLVEKKRLGAYTWSRCHEDEWVTTPELTVAGVAEEGEFQFRVSAVNSFGQSPYLEFPGTVHLGKCRRLSSPRHPDSSLWGHLPLNRPDLECSPVLERPAWLLRPLCGRGVPRILMLLKTLWWEGQVTPTQDSSPQELSIPTNPRALGYLLGLWELKGILRSSNLFSLHPGSGFHSGSPCACPVDFLEEWLFGARHWRRGGEGPNYFLKLSLHSSPAGCENTSEGSGGSGRRRGDLLCGPHYGLIRGVVPGREGPEGQQCVCDTAGWHPPYSHHPLGACQPTRGGAQVRGQWHREQHPHGGPR